METKPARNPGGRRKGASPGKHPSVRHVQGLELYLYTNKTLKEIAKILKVPYHTLLSWYNKEKWAAERRTLAKDLQERLHHETSRIIQENRGAVLRRHIRVGEKIESHIEKLLDKTLENHKLLSAKELFNVGKAFQSSGLVSGNAVGIGEKQQAASTNPVNIMIHTGMSPRPVDDPGPKTIDVEAYDSESLPDQQSAELSEPDDFDRVELDEPDPF